MKQRISVIAVGALGLALGAAACGGSETEAKKEIVRGEVEDSPFRPAALEGTINGLIDALSEETADDPKLGVITKGPGDYWEPVTVGANRALAELDLEGVVEGPPDESDGDVQTDDQIEMFNKRRTGGYGGLGLAPMRERLAEEVDAAIADDIPVVTFDSDLSDSDRQMYIGTNNAEAGRTAGETLADLLSGVSEGTVVVYGYEDTDWVDGHARSMGAKDVLDDAGFETVVFQVGWTEEDIELLQAVVEEITDPPLVGMVGMFSNAYRCAQVAELLDYEPGDIKIAAFDFEPDTVAYMDNGYIQATHVQRQYYMGYLLPYTLYSIRVLGLSATRDLLDEQMIDDERFNTGVDVIGADEIDDYNSFLDSLGIGG